MAAQIGGFVNNPMFAVNGRSSTAKIQTFDYEDESSGLTVTVSPEIAKSAIKNLLINEIGEYVEGAFRLTTNNIDELIKKYNDDMMKFANDKIEAVAQNFVQTLVTRVIESKMSDEIIDELINKLSNCKKNK